MSSFSRDPWRVPAGVRSVDFVIAGAMKSGTSTVHAILAQHPRVFIPDPELHFFDADDLLQHPDFNFFRDGSWTSQQLESDPERFWAWYAAHFADAKPDQLLGEDSTTYLASPLAHRRLARQPTAPKRKGVSQFEFSTRDEPWLNLSEGQTHADQFCKAVPRQF